MKRLTERDENGDIYVKQHNYIEVLKRLAEYEEKEEEGFLLHLPCIVGDTVYVLVKCENIPEQLDGTFYSIDGEFGTATGYYCPYENNCPFYDKDFYNCNDYKKEKAVFEDTVNQIMIDEDGIHIFTEKCCILGTIGYDVFVKQEEAKKVLSDKNHGC